MASSWSRRKAHRGELVKPNDKSKADAASLKTITELRRCAWLLPRSAAAPSWESRYYQFCNRLAHLWWMNSRARVPTWLVWVLIVDDPVWRDQMTAPQWHTAFEKIKREVGLPLQHRLMDKITVVYLPAAS